MTQMIPQWIANMEDHGHLGEGPVAWSSKIGKELCQMSPATIDRYLKEERDKLALKGIATTKPSTLLRKLDSHS